MVERQITELLHQPAGPMDRPPHGAFRLAQPEKYFLAMLRKKSRSRLQHTRLPTQFSFHCNRRPDGVRITFNPTKTESNRRREVLHHVLQNSQLRPIAVFQENFQTAVVIEICQCERPSILEKVQAQNARYIRKRSVPIVCIEYVPLEPAPGAVSADQFVQRVPSLFIIMRRRRNAGRIGNHLPPKKAVQVFHLGWTRWARDHTVRDVKIRESVVIKIPRVARPRPASHCSSRGSACVLKCAVLIADGPGIAKPDVTK